MRIRLRLVLVFGIGMLLFGVLLQYFNLNIAARHSVPTVEVTLDTLTSMTVEDRVIKVTQFWDHQAGWAAGGAEAFMAACDRDPTFEARGMSQDDLFETSAVLLSVDDENFYCLFTHDILDVPDSNIRIENKESLVQWYEGQLANRPEIGGLALHRFAVSDKRATISVVRDFIPTLMILGAPILIGLALEYVPKQKS